LAVEEMKECISRPENDKKFKDWGFTFEICSIRDSSGIDYLLNRICYQSSNTLLNILVDYSSMPKTWYSAIINFFIAYEEKLSHVNIWFSYSPSEYSKSQNSNSIKSFDLVPPSTKSEKPIALVLGLGYEKGRSEELSKKINAKVTFAFYADPAYDERFVQEVLENNHTLLKQIDRDQIVRYPIFDLNSINVSLTRLCIDLRNTHQLILAPVGPKPFTLMCFLLSTRYPDMKIWKVITSGKTKPHDRTAHGELLVYKVTFTSEEVDY
jgi:hypothetical protein